VHLTIITFVILRACEYVASLHVFFTCLEALHTSRSESVTKNRNV